MSVNRKPRLMEQVRQTLRVLHYSKYTERAYLLWIRRFILFHNKRHPKDMCGSEVSEFLSWLANSRQVSASTQNVALNAIIFLYRKVLEIDIDTIPGFDHAKKPVRLPVVLTRDEISRILPLMNEPYRTMAGIMYGSGLRLRETLNLRLLGLDMDRT